ncbi:MAG: hypothetical protein ACYC61_17920 [Isosphaeraceae bacterium]
MPGRRDINPIGEDDAVALMATLDRGGRTMIGRPRVVAGAS